MPPTDPGLIRKSKSRRRFPAGIAILGWLFSSIYLFPAITFADEPVANDGDRAEPGNRLASVPNDAVVPRSIRAPAAGREVDPVDLAKKMMSDCKARFANVKDYTCIFYKRERMADGTMTAQNIMRMKARTAPQAVYFKFVQPTSGREAIYVAGKNKGKALVHDVGIGKLLAGTLAVDPRGATAMEDCRHPITEAGIGHMIDQLNDRWRDEMKSGETIVHISNTAKVGDRPCTLIESTHPAKSQAYLFHKVKVYIDHEHGLPIRFEAYDWPRAGKEPLLMEEYFYHDLKLNPGLREHDFDPKNKQYSFGRF